MTPGYPNHVALVVTSDSIHLHPGVSVDHERGGFSTSLIKSYSTGNDTALTLDGRDVPVTLELLVESVVSEEFVSLWASFLNGSVTSAESIEQSIAIINVLKRLTLK